MEVGSHQIIPETLSQPPPLRGRGIGFFNFMYEKQVSFYFWLDYIKKY
jgi:hypothetical protein